MSRTTEQVFSLSSLGEELGVSYRTISETVARLGLETTRHPLNGAMRALTWDQALLIKRTLLESVAKGLGGE